MSNPAIEAAFLNAHAEGRAALIPYVTAGDPSLSETQAILEALAVGGADIIELGVPFSDPVADGPAIQEASERALRAGATLSAIFELVTEFRKNHQIPIVLFTYVNPVWAYGIEAFADRAAEVGANAVLMVDLTFEEAGVFRKALATRQLDLISLFAPTTDAKRIALMAPSCSGFIYYVSMTGVTGSQVSGIEAIRARVQLIKSNTTLPVAVGFGVRSGPDVSALAAFSDGVVVGSELIRRIHAQSGGGADGARQFISELRAHTPRA